MASVGAPSPSLSLTRAYSGRHTIEGRETFVGRMTRSRRWAGTCAASAHSREASAVSCDLHCVRNPAKLNQKMAIRIESNNIRDLAKSNPTHTDT